MFSLNVHVVMMLRQLREPQTTETREVREASGRLHSMGKNSAQENARFQKSHSCHGTRGRSALWVPAQTITMKAGSNQLLCETLCSH